MRRLLLPVFALLIALAGCTAPGGGSSDDYPDDYVATDNLPGDLRLMGTGHPAWPFIADVFGMDANPDEVDPRMFEPDEDEENASVPEHAYVALYVRGSDEEAVVFAAAGRFADEDRLRAGLDEEDCREARAEGHARFLQDGRVGVVIGGFSGDAALRGYVDELAERVVDATGATDVC